jgi:para-nitrobenzyl esterase
LKDWGTIMTTRRHITAALAVVCLLGASGPGWSQGADATLVKTSLGQLKGSAADGVAVFKGIPFAAPPVGDLRWRATKPAAKWDGVRPATAFSQACNQVEDCLYLNVWKPANAAPGAKLPVMVWIHGGAFINGSGAGVDGTEFAKQGVILVSVNYRLGRLGFFAHPALTKEDPKAVVGNYGILDQIEALRWVQANIGAFGGDAKNVTIFGESAGAICVNLIMLAPQAHGLFAKAASESGFGRRPLKLVHTDDGSASGEQIGYAFAQKNGVATLDAAAAKSLRALPFSAFANPPGVAQPDQPSPMIDGKLVASTIHDGFKKGREAKVPYLIGGNSNESSLYRGILVNGVEYANVTDRKEAMLAAFDPEKSGNVERTVARLVTDQRISEPDRALARIHSKSQPTFVYHFSYTPIAGRAASLGAAHGGEISYVFNTLNGGRGGPPDAEGVAISRSMNSYWAAFAKTGNPGTAGGPTWPKWDNTGESLMEFPAGGKPAVQSHFHKARLDWVEQGVGTWTPIVGR